MWYWLSLLAMLVVVALGLYARRWFPVRVEGESMLPSLRPGDLLACRRLFKSEPRPGQVVIARRGGREMVKRVAAPPGELAPDAIWLVGDNADHSTDSRSGGPFHRGDIAGVARVRYWPAGRAGRVR